MKPRQIHFDILRASAELYRISRITPESIRVWLLNEYTPRQIILAIHNMCLKAWDYPTGPWLMALSGDRYDITGTGARDSDEDVTGGWRAWREMNDSPVLQHQTSAWIDEALTGITPDGKRSKITRAVLSNWKPGVE